MKNQPLTSNDHAKLLLFGFLMLPAILLFGVGLIPALFLGFGVFMMKKSKSFSYIETATKYFKVYALLIGFGWGSTAAYSLSDINLYGREFQISLFFSIIAFAYWFVVDALFYSVLENHSEWVEANGIFSSKLAGSDQTSEVSIVRAENLNQYSVADELTKWVKLKDDGHITEEEFNDARKKLLR